MVFFFFFSSRRRHTRCGRDWSSDVCSSDLYSAPGLFPGKSEVSAGLGGHAEGAKAEIEIAPGKNTSLDLALKRSSPILTPADWIPQLPDDRDGVKQLVINRCVNCHGPVNFVRSEERRVGKECRS